MKEPNFQLKLALLKRGVTQRDLAFEIRTSESRISKIIRGYEKPTPEIARAIANFLGVHERECF